MFKMLVTLGTFLVVALSLLALRHHRLEVTSDSVRIRNDIIARQQTLLDERADIARQVTPWTLAANLKAAGMDTGDAVTSHSTTPAPVNNRPQPGAVETDLVAPLMNNDGSSGHSNRNRPH